MTRGRPSVNTQRASDPQRHNPKGLNSDSNYTSPFGGRLPSATPVDVTSAVTDNQTAAS